jgi:hypothetical protein
MSSSKKKKERQRLRYEKNVQKEIVHKKHAWDNGKLIEENHNQGPYSENYTIALSQRLVQYISQERKRALQTETPAQEYVRGFRKYKIKIQDLILHWNPLIPRGIEYNFLKTLLEVYWDEVLANQNDAALLSVL